MRFAASVTQTLGLPVAGVLVSLVTVNRAGVEVWGAFVGLLVVVQLMAQVADFGSRDALVRAFSRDPGHVVLLWRAGVASRAPLLLLGPAVFVSLAHDLPTLLLMWAWLAGLFVVRLHDGPVAYRRAFGTALAFELLGVALTLGLVVVASQGRLVPAGLLAIFTASTGVRALLYSARFGMLRAGPGWELRVAELRRSWPFFGLTFSGAVQSRVDLYVVAALLPAAALGSYQVLTSLVLLVQSLAGGLLNPVVPALYRLSRASVLAGTRRLLALGVGVTAAGAFGVALLMDRAYGVTLPVSVLAAAWLAMLPAFGYVPLVYLAFRDGHERLVLWANLVGIAASGGLALLLVPSLGVLGAMLGSATAQAAILAIHVGRTRQAGGLAAAASAARDVRRVEAPDALPRL